VLSIQGFAPLFSRKVSSGRTELPLPVAIITWTPIDGDNPGAVSIIVPVVVISVVMSLITIAVIAATVVIS